MICLSDSPNSRVARTVNVVILRLRSGFGGLMVGGGGPQAIDARQLPYLRQGGA